MGTWGWILVFILGIAAFILTISFLFNAVVYWVAARHSEKTIRKYTRELEKLLPGANCGKCGCKSCKEFALAVFDLEKDADLCTMGAEEMRQKLNAKMEEFQKLLQDDASKKKEIDDQVDR